MDSAAAEHSTAASSSDPAELVLVGEANLRRVCQEFELGALVARLPESERTIVELRYLTEPPVPQLEVAARLGLSERTIRDREARALDLLRGHIARSRSWDE